MNLVKFFKTGKIKKLALGMNLNDFYQTKISQQVSDIIYADDTHSEVIFHTQKGIQIRFSAGKIASISLDPNYPKFKLGNVKLTPCLTLNELIKFYDKHEIDWDFVPREFEKECEVITKNPKISVIFCFKKGYVAMPNIQLQND